MENALGTARAQAIDMGSELKQTNSLLDAAKAELGAYQRPLGETDHGPQQEG